ncbi:MAG: FHA domain-containing protein [Bacteriovoracia bacterium]
MKLTFHTSTDGVQTFDVEKNSVLVGRGSACDVKLKVEGISRQHCLIEVNPRGEIFITDLGSANGVLIDNQRIPINRPVAYLPILSLAIGPVPAVSIEIGDMVQINRIIDPAKAEAKKKKRSSEPTGPLLKLDLEDRSRSHSGLIHRGHQQVIRRKEREPVVKTEPPWIMATLALGAILASTYFLFFKN